MEAPEKIYIQPNIGGSELIKTWFPVKIDQESIEYVRKDAFVEEVDLEKEMNDYFVSMEVQENENIFESTFRLIAKHFFELGLKAQKGENNITRKEVENLKERFKPIHDSGRRMFGSEAYDSHIKEVLKFFGYDTEDGVIKEIFNI